MYPFYRHHVTTRSSISSPLVIDLICSYDSVANTGTVTATVNNTSGSSVSGNIHFAIIENNIPYNWGNNLNTVEHVLRDMVPNANGESVTIPASDTIIRSRNFTINSTWNELNCKVVVFVQGATREIYQGAEIAIIQEPEMEYFGLSLSETSGNGNGWAEPGESIEIRASGKNFGDGIYIGGASIQCSDPYITITGSAPATVSIGAGDVDTVMTFTFDISSGCLDPYLTSFELSFGSSVDTLPFMITSQSGFSDDIESGPGSWTHSGTNDNWHITEYKNNSPTHSWYCGVEGSWQYTNENISSLTSPYFVSTPDSSLYFYHQYSLETNWDYGYIEVDNGSGWWRSFAEVNGAQSSWVQDSYSLNEYNGQTARIRFRFISDYSVTQEGWYIDDIRIPMIIGINEDITDSAVNSITLRVYPNPFTRRIYIRCQTGDDSEVSLKVYSATGRLVKQFSRITNHQQVSWDGTDERGSNLPAGIYFIMLEGNNCTRKEKVILCR